MHCEVGKCGCVGSMQLRPASQLFHAFYSLVPLSDRLAGATVITQTYRSA
jgi:hypothetical protein